MKYFLPIIAIIVLALIASRNYYSSPDNKIHLEIEHVNSGMMENLLNQYQEVFLQTEIDWTTWKNKNLIEEKYSFRTSQSTTALYLIFARTQEDAVRIGEDNFPSQTKNLAWGVNGAVLFVVGGEDKWQVSKLLGYFAGEE